MVEMKCLNCGEKFTGEDVEDYDVELQGDFPHVKEVGIPHCPNCGSKNTEV